MNAVEKLRAIVAKSPSVQSPVPGVFILSTDDCAELLQEFDRLRAESAETREACARICDERNENALDQLEECSSEMFNRLVARADEAEDCAAAIRAGGKP